MMEEKFYIKSRIAQLEAKLKELEKHERVYPLSIAKIKREIDNERKMLEEGK